jgi:hypothetical protein
VGGPGDMELELQLQFEMRAAALALALLISKSYYCLLLMCLYYLVFAWRHWHSLVLAPDSARWGLGLGPGWWLVALLSGSEQSTVRVRACSARASKRKPGNISIST